MPTAEEIPSVIKGFLKHSPVPQVIGAIDGCHINILKPNEHGEDYINRHDVPSIILPGLVGDSYLFRDIFVGWSGKSHEARVLKNSPFFQTVCQGAFVPAKYSVVIKGQSVPPLILGDSAYPLQDWQQKPFLQGSGLTPQQVHFNNCLSMDRVVVENAFGRLKGKFRFRCIAKRLDLKVDNCVLVVSACCTLHNYCELSHQTFNKSWLGDIQVNYTPTHQVGSLQQDQNASAIRDAILQYLVENADQ